MFLLAISTVKPFVDPFYCEHRSKSELIGFWPCSDLGGDSHTKYYSVDALPRGRVVPVFYVPDMVFDDEDYKVVEPHPALFFMGCDDGHTGLSFSSREEAMQWLDSCKYADFELFFRACCDGTSGVKLHYHN